MLEGALTFLVILTSLRVHLGKWYNGGCTQSTGSKKLTNRIYCFKGGRLLLEWTKRHNMLFALNYAAYTLRSANCII